MNWSIDFAPLLPLPLLWAAAAIAAVLIGFLIYRRSRGAGLRALALMALIGALTNPVLRQEERESLSNVAVVVMDESTSQALAKRPEQSASIKADLEKRLAGIKNLDVKWTTAGKPSEHTAHGTALFDGLNKALADTPPDRLAGVIFITDGQVHDVPATAAALGFAAPVHALLTGRPGEFDRRIEVLKAPRYGIVGQSRDMELVVREMGRMPNSGSEASKTATLKIRKEGSPEETRVAEIGKPITIEMPFPHSGTNILEVEMPAAPGELTPANNRAVLSAEGVRENLRVLLVSGVPHAGERTWRNLLKSDAGVDLVHFTILRPPEKQDGTRINELSLIQFPTKELFSDKIKDFDLIIFDRYEHRGILQLLYYDNITRYVDKSGGALLVAGGDDYAGERTLFRTPLGPALPAAPTGRVIEGPFRAKITTDGAKHPVTSALPGVDVNHPEATPAWGRWFRQAEVTTGSSGRTVMQGAEDKPLLILDRKGKGRVALLTSDQAWLWARGYDGGGPHTDLLRRLAHWLMKEPELEEDRLIATASGLKITIERHSMDDKVEPVTLISPEGEKSQIVLDPAGPGRWRSSLDVKLPGLYKAETAAQTGPLTAIAEAGSQDPREMSEVTATQEKLEPITQATGGGVFWTAEAATNGASAAQAPAVELPRITLMSNATRLAGSGWMGLKDREAFVTRGVKLTPLFTGLLALSALLALLALAWWREGR
ncbi:MAG: hypothetical protein ABL894_14675 [Hyphomicrobium sp.]